MVHERRSPFVDDSGNPRLRNSITAFLDILGYSQLCNADQKIEESQRILNRINSALHYSLRFLNSNLTPDEQQLLANAEASFFSDNLVYAIACDRDDDLLESVLQTARCVQVYQLRMALNGFFIRGGVTQGPICVTNELIFGQALIDSYKLESKASIVPRVVICPDLLEIVTTRMLAAGNLSRGNWFCRDIDGMWFVNYLEAAKAEADLDWGVICEHKQSILQEIKSSHHHHVLPKFGWLCRYHNVFCHWHRDDPGYRKEARIDRVDEESIIHRWSEIMHSIT